MKIAILASGSLVWDHRDLAIAEEFQSNGPRLPIEFGRVSSDGRLTLVIDETRGAPCATDAAESAFGDLNAAASKIYASAKACQARRGSAPSTLPPASRAAERLNDTRGRSKKSRRGLRPTAMTPRSGRRLRATSMNLRKGERTVFRRSCDAISRCAGGEKARCRPDLYSASAAKVRPGCARRSASAGRKDEPCQAGNGRLARIPFLKAKTVIATA